MGQEGRMPKMSSDAAASHEWTGRICWSLLGGLPVGVFRSRAARTLGDLAGRGGVWRSVLTRAGTSVGAVGASWWPSAGSSPLAALFNALLFARRTPRKSVDEAGQRINGRRWPSWAGTER